MGHAGNQRRKSALLLRLRAGQRQRAHGAAVKGAQKGDDVLAAGVVARQFEGAFDGLGAGVAVEKLVRSGHGRDGREPVSQIGHRLAVEVGSGDVQQFSGLLLDCGDHFGVAMAGGDHGDARREVEKLVAVRVFHANAAAALGHQRIRARIAGRDEPVIGLDGSLGLGSGQGTDDLWSVLRVHFLLSHFFISSTDSVVRPCNIISMPGRGSHWDWDRPVLFALRTKYSWRVSSAELT